MKHKVAKKSHNLPMCRVVVGGGVVVGHPSTNHNSPHGWVVAFLCHFMWHKTYSSFKWEKNDF